MTNESQLQLHGSVTAKKYGRAPLYIAATVFAVCLIVAMWQMGLLEDTRAPKVVPEAAPAPSDTRERPLVQKDTDAQGVLGAKPEEKKEEADLPPIQVVVQAPADPSIELYRQQAEELRKRRTEAALAARSAPLGMRQGNQEQQADTRMSQTPPTGTRSASSSGLDTPGQRSDVEQKEDFFSRSRAEDDWRSPHTRQAGLPYELKTGTVVPGVLLTGVNSDLPGSIIGQVSQNVYDSATGRHLLIPRGARIYGVYDARVAMGQSRVLIAWNRILFPDGSSVTLGAMPGASPEGASGFTDQVNNHYMRIFGSGVLMSLISGGMAYSLDKLDANSGNSSDNPTLQNEMGSALAGQLGQSSMRLLERNASLSPTLQIRSGYTFNIVLTKDVTFETPYEF